MKPIVNNNPVAPRVFALENVSRFLPQRRTLGWAHGVQRAPDLLSYLQPEVDERPEPGRFILTGSQNLFEVLWTGAYPRIFDRQIPPHQRERSLTRVSVP